MWPAGSSGWRQNGHGGRPAETSACARATKSRAYDAVILTTKTSSASTSSLSASADAVAASLSSASASLSTLENSSITIRSMLGSQAMVIVPTRNSSVIGASSGSVSDGVLDAGGTGTPP